MSEHLELSATIQGDEAMPGPVLRRVTLIERLLRLLGWRNAPDHSLRGRLWSAFGVGRRHDWGHVVMALVGRVNCGNFDPPRGRDMYYRRDPDSGHIVTTFVWPGMDAREQEWKVFNVQDDGFTVTMGYYDGGFFGLDRTEQRMFLRWFLIECKLRGEWLGLRRWIYYKALHAAIEDKRHGTCQRVPGKDTGGYSHWHCQLSKRHTGPHRFGNYVWSELRGRVEHSPTDTVNA